MNEEVLTNVYVNDTADVRDELITLAEGGKIKYTVKYIKKANSTVLEKIKADYERKHLDETNEYISSNIISSFASLLKHFGIVKNQDDLASDLNNNYLLKRDVKSIVGVITPIIPYVGLLCGGITVGKHVVINVVEPEEKEHGDVHSPEE